MDLTGFSVIKNCTTIQQQRKTNQVIHFLPDLPKSASFQNDQSDYCYKMSDGCEIRHLPGPVGHAVNAGEKAAHQHKDHHKKESDEHGL